VIVGGWRSGMNRARDHSLLYIRNYCFLALLLSPVEALFTGWGGLGELVMAFIVGYMLGVILLLPCATLTFFVAFRLLRLRSWKQQRWRFWIAGALVVLLSWAALVSGIAEWLKPPSFLVSVMGRSAEIPYALGCLVLLQSMAIAMAWIPFRRNKRSQRGKE
jgi:hypothetical protein